MDLHSTLGSIAKYQIVCLDEWVCRGVYRIRQGGGGKNFFRYLIEPVAKLGSFFSWQNFGK